MGDEADRVAMRFGRGARCFAVMIDAAVAGYGWLSTGPEWVGELQLEITPGPREGYVWNCVTLEEHRRKGVFSSLLVGISEAARRDGLRRLWIGTVAIPGESALAPAGFRPALLLIALAGVGVHFLRVAEGPEPRLATDAFAVLPIRRGVLVRRIQRRRH